MSQKKFIIYAYSFLSIFFSIDVCLAESNFESDVSWSDEFYFWGAVDSNYWNHDQGVFGKELQRYTSDKSNSYKSLGVLYIKALKSKNDTSVCTSARIHTKGKVSFLYGKIEIRAKVPVGKGVFPAIWMLPEKWMPFPYGEIDLLEYYHCFEQKQYQANVHVHVGDKKNDHKQHPFMISADVSNWHKYTLEWYKDKLVFLLDDKIVHELRKENMEGWPFDRPYYLYLNVAFGSWGGTCGIDENIFPQTMEVDYVRYYKLKEE